MVNPSLVKRFVLTFALSHLIFAALFCSPAYSELSDNRRNELKQRSYVHIANKFQTQVNDDNLVKIEFTQASFTSKTTTETLVHIQYYVGEGVVDNFLLLYDNRNTSPALLASTNSHSEYQEHGYIRHADLDKDGVQEILVVGDTDGENNSTLSIFSIKNNEFVDVVYDGHSGIDYFLLQAPDKSISIYTLSRQGERTAWYHYQKNAQSFYSASSVVMSNDTLLTLLNNLAAQKYIERSNIRLPLLYKQIRQRQLRPDNLSLLQKRLQQHFHNTKDNYRKATFVQLMGWPGNSYFLSFFNSHTSNKKYADILPAFIKTLSVTQGKSSVEPLTELFATLFANSKSNAAAIVEITLMLEKWDKGSGIRALKQRLDKMDKDGSDYQDAVYWIMGDERLLPQTEPFLYELAVNAKNAELRRLASSRLSTIFSDFTTSLAISQLQRGLHHNDSNVRAEFALIMGYSGNKACVPLLLDAYVTEKERWPRRQMLIALGNLKSPQVIPLYRQNLFTEKDPEFSFQMLWQLKNVGYRFTADEILLGLRSDIPKDSVVHFIELAAKSRIGMPDIIKLIKTRKSSYIVYNAIKSLAQFDHPQARAFLRQIILHQQDGDIRSLAVEALGKNKHIENETLFMQLISSHNLIVKKAAITALARLQTAKGIALIAKEMRREDAIIDNYLEAVVLSQSLELSKVLEQYLKNMDRQLKLGTLGHYDFNLFIRICNVFRQRHENRCETYTDAWMSRDSPVQLRIEIISYIKKFGSPRQKANLQQYVNDPFRSIRIAVISPAG